MSRVLTTHLTTLLRLIWMLLESTEDAPLNYIPTWAQKIELWLVYTLFLTAASKGEIALSKLTVAVKK